MAEERILFPGIIEHNVGNVVSRIETDKIQQSKWSHGISATELHRFIDVFNLPTPSSRARIASNIKERASD